MLMYWKIASRKISPVVWQLDDWKFAWDNLKCAILRSRGGSKTYDFTNWLVFRVLRTREDWIWMCCKGGQLQQARIYFQKNPFVQQIINTKSSNFYVKLWSGDMILCGIISTSNLGLRMDGIIYDEFEDLQSKQESEVYPQMYGMMTTSPIHKEIYCGTRWIATLFDQKCEDLPLSIHEWTTCPWLVASGAIAEEIALGVTPEWELDLLYRCIPTAPFGIMYPTFVTEDLSDFTWYSHEIQYGVDFGSMDTVVGVVRKIDTEGVAHAYIVEEYSVQLELFPDALDHLRACFFEVEGGGYNDSDKYGNKSRLLMDRLNAVKQSVTNKWKAERQMVSRSHTIHCDRNLTPQTYSDVKSATFGPDGLYLKDSSHPCHFLDAFLHTFVRNRSSYTAAPPRRSAILQAERERERYR